MSAAMGLRQKILKNISGLAALILRPGLQCPGHGLAPRAGPRAGPRLSRSALACCQKTSPSERKTTPLAWCAVAIRQTVTPFRRACRPLPAKFFSHFWPLYACNRLDDCECVAFVRDSPVRWGPRLQIAKVSYFFGTIGNQFELGRCQPLAPETGVLFFCVNPQGRHQAYHRSYRRSCFRQAVRPGSQNRFPPRSSQTLQNRCRSCSDQFPMIDRSIAASSDWKRFARCCVNDSGSHRQPGLQMILAALIPSF